MAGRLSNIAMSSLSRSQDNEKGLTLIETLVALAILGAVAVVFITSLTTSIQTAAVSQERVVAESLAKSTMEFIKNSEYDYTNDPPDYMVDPNLAIPAGYSIPDPVTAERLDPDEDGLDDDDGIQKITVTIIHNGDTVLTLENYKVDR